jgi:predicted nucleic acid-binding protein
LVVLDSWALLAYLKDEPAAERIEEEWLSGGAAICSINLGEALYIRIRDRGEDAAANDIEAIRVHSTVVDPDWALTLVAAQIKARGGLSYADAFCVATAKRLAAPLWTGDPEIVGQTAGLGCEVVDLRTAEG